MKTVAIISQKGGSGKTTTLMNLAIGAQQKGSTVLVIDLDMQASATDWYKARVVFFEEREKTRAEKEHRARGPVDPSPLVQPTHPAGLPQVLKAAETQGVDFVFIDTAAKTESDTAAAIEAADLVLITCRPSVVDLRAMRNSIRLCQVHEVTPHIVLTQIEPQGTLRAEARRTLEKLGVDVLDAGLGRRAAFHHSSIEGRGATEYEPEGKAANEVRRLLRAVCHLAGLPASKQDGKMAKSQAKRALR